MECVSDATKIYIICNIFTHKMTVSYGRLSRYFKEKFTSCYHIHSNKQGRVNVVCREDIFLDVNWESCQEEILENEKYEPMYYNVLIRAHLT